MTSAPRLKDLGRWSSGGTPPRDQESLWEGEVPWISAKDFDHDKLREPTAFISEGAAREHSRVVEPDSILLIVRGMALAHGLPVAHVPEWVAFNQDLRALVVAPEYLPRFVYYALRGNRPWLNAHIDKAAHGTARLLDSAMAERVAVPSWDEQRDVAEFLDRECERIVRLGRELQGLTFDLDRYASASFLATLGPNFAVAPLRRFITSIADGPFGSSLASEHYVSSSETRVIRLGNIGVAEFLDHDQAFVGDEYARNSLSEHFVGAGDVIVAGLGDAGHPLGRACLVPTEILPAVHKADCYRLVPDPRRCTSSFLAQALSLGPARDQAPLMARGATRARLNTVVARDLPVPDVGIETQLRVVGQVERSREQLSRLRSEIDGSRRLLAGYRDALITEAVTGKLDVARLSDRQLDESAHAALEGEQPEVLA